ncbi:MAG: xcpT 51 [Pedosphaera sp.]|nr:xcpT 51 [Pedosphaera sp.]
MIMPINFLQSARQLRVNWSNRAWTPRIVVGRAVGHGRVCKSSSHPQHPAAACAQLTADLSQSMKNKSMKNSSLRNSHSSRGFTLIELLVVIAIIAVLAGLLLPVIGRAKITAKKNTARQEMKNLGAAISQYDAEYSRFPAPATGASDLTFGWVDTNPVLPTAVTTNSDVMLVIQDLNVGINFSHAKNPRQLALFTATTVSDITTPGISSLDYQFRDPFGHPYIITMDLDGDGNCRDAVYSRKEVSMTVPNTGVGLNGLVDATGTGSGPFDFHGPVMIWSFGPDGKADSTIKANQGVNKDNLLSWQ